MEKFEQKQYLPEEKEPTEEATEKIEIPKEDWETLKIIAKRVGGDFRMKVKLGEPGGGSFFNPEDGSITFDPLHIKENPDLSKFVAAHEGAHRAITLSPKELGLSQKEIESLYSQIGFGYLQNVIEDPAVNDWMSKRFPGLKPYTEKIYNEQLKEENAVLSTPEVRRIASQLGYWPKFVQYGSEVIRDWYQKRFSRKLDPAVEKALKRTIRDARESINTIPDPQKPSREKKEIISVAQKRFENNTNNIWPEVKKLVEMDLHTEEQRQMLKEFRQKQKELELKRKEMEKAKARRDAKKQEELQKEIKGLEEELDPFNGLPGDVKKELQKQIDKAIRGEIEQLNKEIEEKQKQIEETRKKQEKLDKEIKDLEEKLKGATNKEKEGLEKEIQEKKTEKLTQERKRKQAKEELKSIQDSLEQIQSGEEMPYPEDKLSDKTKQELEKLFNKLPLSKKKEHRQKAQEKLEDFEDAVNEELQGKLNKDKPESHREFRERQEEKKESEERRRKAEEEKRELEKKLERRRREKMTEYDKAYEETANIINSLYNRLKRFFLPERHPKWRKGYPTGQKVELEKAMQAEADPRYLEKLWKRKTIPHKLDYRFSILVDLSGSMKGEKIEETFKGVVVLAEVLERLGIQYEIRGFSNNSRVFKNWREKLTPQLRNRLAEMKNWGGEGTETTLSTKKAVEDFEKNLGKDNFLITLTDGQPNNSESLKKLLKEIKEKKRIKLVGIGLGPDTEFVKDYYPAFSILPNVKPTEQQRKKGQKDFGEAFADLLEDMVRHPEKY